MCVCCHEKRAAFIKVAPLLCVLPCQFQKAGRTGTHASDRSPRRSVRRPPSVGESQLATPARHQYVHDGVERGLGGDLKGAQPRGDQGI